MTVAFWLATGQTVVFLAVIGFAWWQIRLLVEACDAARDTNEMQRADSDVLHAWWNQCADWHNALLDGDRLEPADRQPTTAMPAVRTDTVEEPIAASLIDDTALAWEMARIENQLHEWRQHSDDSNPPAKRAGTSRKGAT